MEEGTRFSLCSLKLTTVVRLAIVLAREDVQVHLLAPQTWTEHFWLCVCGLIVILKNCIIVRKQHLDHRMQLPI